MSDRKMPLPEDYAERLAEADNAALLKAITIARGHLHTPMMDGSHVTRARETLEDRTLRRHPGLALLAELERLRAVAEAARKPCDCNYVSGHWADCDLKQALAAWEASRG